MTEAIFVEDSVQVAAEDPPVGADTPIQFSGAKGGEGLCTFQIQSLTDMNLIARNSTFRQWLAEERATIDGARADARDLLWLHRGADGEQAKPWHAALALDPERVGEFLAKHLHTTADT